MTARPPAARTFSTQLQRSPSIETRYHDATLRGLVIMAQPVPGIAAFRVSASPFGATTTQEWSLPALGAGSIAAASLEPDPAVEWDDERVARIRQVLGSPLPPYT
jgi:hypothetical protein